MNPFERHGVNWLSPSSLNLWQAEPSLWVMRYLFAMKDEMGPAARRGTAVEAGLDVHLIGGATREEARNVALQNFALNTDGLADDEHEAERNLIVPMVDQACEAMPLDTVGRPVARQLKIEHRVPGIEVPIVGYVDYLWDDHGIDLKTTKRMPSQASADHLRQISIYSAAKSRPFKLLYVTDKKRMLYGAAPSDVEDALKDMERIARSLRKVLEKSDCREEVAEFFVPNRDSFRWNEATLKEVERVKSDHDNRSKMVSA